MNLIIDSDAQDLDIEYTVGIASGVPISFLSIGEDNQDDIDGFLDEVNFLLSESVIPNALTTSYSFNEPDLPDSVATCVHASLLLHLLFSDFNELIPLVHVTGACAMPMLSSARAARRSSFHLVMVVCLVDSRKTARLSCRRSLLHVPCKRT